MMISVAFLGNSILYFNDCPRVMEYMLETKFPENVKTDSCLRGGTSLKELWTQSNGMSKKFATIKNDDGSYDIGAPSVQSLLHDSQWDYCVMNDFTQGPARISSREESKQMLERCYAPLLQKSGAIPIIIQTTAYRKPIRGTNDLGSVPEWTQRLDEGCREYVEVLKQALPTSQTPRLAPVGNAYLSIYENDCELWEKLFYIDDFHPSPHGTWLQACVLYCVIVGQAPPIFTPDIWKRARYMQRVNKESSPLPTKEEAAVLREYACRECGISIEVK